MQLDSSTFFFFLAVVVICRAFVPQRFGPSILLVASVIFYATWSLPNLFLLLGLCGINFLCVRALSAIEEDKRRSLVFAFAAILNVGVLAFYKYASHAATTIAAAFGLETLSPDSPLARIALPLGLSFFTFQMLACVTDAYRRDWDYREGFGTFLLFGLFFPQISSGPIPRAKPLVPQLAAGSALTSKNIVRGLNLIAFGLFQKFVVANRLTAYVDEAFAGSLEFTTVSLVIACCFNALALYADFSGYTDIARGSARLFGIDLLINFNRPLVARSMTDFWRRWHLSFSTWLRDYLYNPLVIRVRRLGKMAIVAALLITFVVAGLWHGVGWTWVLFGIIHGIALSLEVLTLKQQAWLKKRMPRLVSTVLAHGYAMSIFVGSLILFRAPDVPSALGIVREIFSFRMPTSAAELFAYQGPFLFAYILFALVAWPVVAFLFHRRKDSLRPDFILVTAIIILLFGKTTEGNFIYVQF